MRLTEQLQQYDSVAGGDDCWNHVAYLKLTGVIRPILSDRYCNRGLNYDALRTSTHIHLRLSLVKLLAKQQICVTTLFSILV